MISCIIYLEYQIFQFSIINTIRRKTARKFLLGGFGVEKMHGILTTEMNKPPQED